MLRHQPNVGFELAPDLEIRPGDLPSIQNHFMRDASFIITDMSPRALRIARFRLPLLELQER
jgi:hypothetical protein